MLRVYVLVLWKAKMFTSESEDCRDSGDGNVSRHSQIATPTVLGQVMSLQMIMLQESFFF